MSGFETLAQVYREIASPKLRNLKLAANIVCVYAIVSTGKDGASESTLNGGATTNFDCDIVYSNGSFIQFPEGMQSSQ